MDKDKRIDKCKDKHKLIDLENLGQDQDKATTHILELNSRANLPLQFLDESDHPTDKTRQGKARQGQDMATQDKTE